LGDMLFFLAYRVNKKFREPEETAGRRKWDFISLIGKSQSKRAATESELPCLPTQTLRWDRGRRARNERFSASSAEANSLLMNHCERYALACRQDARAPSAAHAVVALCYS